MISPRTVCALAALAVAIAGRAYAADDTICSNGYFPDQAVTFGLAQVGGTERLYFLNDVNGCPNDTPACRQKAYVLAGDKVLTAKARGAYVCAFFPNKGGGSAGWVRRDRLITLRVDPAPPLSAWVGAWKNGDDSIDLKVKGGLISADGAAFWPSANPSLKDRPGGPNLGEFSGDAKPAGNRAFFADDVCQVKLLLVGPWLLAADNEMCGGHNVRFDGVYARK